MHRNPLDELTWEQRFAAAFAALLDAQARIGKLEARLRLAEEPMAITLRRMEGLEQLAEAAQKQAARAAREQGMWDRIHAQVRRTQELHDVGMSDAAIAEQMGVTKNTVWRYRRNLDGIATRAQARATLAAVQ